MDPIWPIHLPKSFLKVFLFQVILVWPQLVRAIKLTLSLHSFHIFEILVMRVILVKKTEITALTAPESFHEAVKKLTIYTCPFCNHFTLFTQVLYSYGSSTSCLHYSQFSFWGFSNFYIYIFQRQQYDDSSTRAFVERWNLWVFS